MDLHNFKTRSYRKEDYQNMINLFLKSARSVWPDYKRGKWDEELDDIHKNIIEHGGDFIIGVNEGLVIAMGAFRKKSQEVAELSRMRVDPEHHRKGFGQRILSALEESAKKKGFKVVELHTSTAQKAAQKLYEKNNYIEVGRKKAEYDPNMTTIHYRKEIV